MSSIEIEGLDVIMAKLDKLASEEVIKSGIEKGCAMVEASAKQKAPKDTGALRRSITSEVEGLEGKIYTPLEYAPYVEYGTGLFAEKGGRQSPWSYKDDEGNWHTTTGQNPQPFMRPALKENKDKIIENIKEGLIKL